MAATERLMNSLQQSSSAMGSSPILSSKSFHPSHDFGRSSRKLIPLPPVQASMAGNEDQRSSTVSKSHHENSGGRSSGVSSLLKAVQDGGSSAVMQQVSSIRHFFMPELPQVVLREIKKRMALPFKDQHDEENPIQDDLNGGLVKEGLAEEQVAPQLGPRCAWPRLSKLAAAEEERQEEVIQGPRCAWPRAGMQTQTASSYVQPWKQEEGDPTAVGEGASGAKCAWPRAISRIYHQNNLVSSRTSLEGSQKMGKLEGSQEEGLVITKSSQEGLERGAISKCLQEELEKRGICNSSQEGLNEKEALQKRAQECSKEEARHVHDKVIEGPRCAWPRSTPRRMLATGVGLSLLNYLLIDQSAPAFAILLETPLPNFTCEEEPLHPLPSFLP